jgi:hypothetical protein
VSITVEQRDGGLVVVVDGDLAVPATLIQLHTAFARIGFAAPVVVDLSRSTGSSPEVIRLLDRTARLMAHRGVPFDVVNSALMRL